MPIQKVIIIGGGIAGVAAAIALKKFNNLDVEIFELRPEFSTLGGAINLTPFAMRYLDHLGVASKLIPLSCEVARIEMRSLRNGAYLGQLDYSNVEKLKFRGRRVMRATLMDALLDTLRELGVQVQYGKKAETIAVDDQGVEVKFADGQICRADMLLGADGMHSFTRMNVIEPDRKPIYTGIAGAYGLMDAKKLSKPLPMDTTCLYSGRRGAIIFSYYDEAKTQIYAGAIMETPQAESRDGWKVKGEAKAEVKANIRERFGTSSGEPVIDEILANIDEWFFHPAFKLAPRGKWFNEKCLLIGDAAHAVSITDLHDLSPRTNECRCLLEESPLGLRWKM
jgi:2-polyprenyl-6-methoxyphenol hydroxylase-like FAD-dependent oxidoreductase